MKIQRNNAVFATGALCLALGVAHAAPQETSASKPSRLVFGFEMPTDAKSSTQYSAKVSTVTKTGATEGQNALQIDFTPADYPHVKWDATTPWDWSGYGGLAIDVTNPSTTETVNFAMRIDDDSQANGITHCRTGNNSLGPGQTATFVMPFGADPMAVGMRGLPGFADMRNLGASGSGEFNWGHIVAFQIFLNRPASAKTLIVDNIRLVPGGTQSLNRIIDRFGQYTGTKWKGKITTEEELQLRKTAEELQLQAQPALSDRDKYGGWAKGPRLKATGFFRTEKYQNKWTLVDPDGRLFFSLGIDTVGSNASTITTGREYMFAALPKDDPVLARHAGKVTEVHLGPVKAGDTVDFYGANLDRKYGTGYAETWKNVTLSRLPAWGFNTIGNFSDWSFYNNGRVPYVVAIWAPSNHARIASGNDYWRTMDDSFDPKFAADVAQSAQQMARIVRDDPYCLGYFVGNEESWGGGENPRAHYGLALGALKLEQSASPAKQAFVAQLQVKYKDIAALNAAWKTSFANWETLAAPYAPTERLAEGFQADLSLFLTHHAAKYFQTVRDAIRKVDPNHLYLGCRFANYTPEAVQASAIWTDVSSFNVYRLGIDLREWKVLDGTDHPVIIGEFHFGALDRGMFHAGLVPTANQKERAQAYADYVNSVLDNPLFVGCHWFQYTDEATTGRSLDGENYNIGFVSITDTPYAEMVQAARQVHASAYTRRYGSNEAKTAPKPTTAKQDE